MTTKALMLGAFGARGTGKTAWVRQQINAAKPARLAIWDFKHDPALVDLGTAYTDLGAFIRALKAKAFKARFLVNHAGDIHAQFELFCLACWEAGCLLMFVDELPEVTKSNKAPPAWRRCVNVGRDYVVNGARKWLAIIGAGQRPAECDKSFISNCDVIHSGRLANPADAKAMADAMGCEWQGLLRMPDLDWVERRAGDMEPLRGRLTFAKKRVTVKPAAPVPKASPLRERISE